MSTFIIVSMKPVAPSLQAILWSKKLSKLNLKKDKIYIIHQILAYGSLKDLAWLFKTFQKKEIIEIFSRHPQKIYTPSQLNFAKNIILNLKISLDEKKYLKTSS